MAEFFIAPRENETPEEERFREAINRLCNNLMGTIDGAIQLRTSAPETQRMRHLARGHLQNFALMAHNTSALHAALGPRSKKKDQTNA